MLAASLGYAFFRIKYIKLFLPILTAVEKAIIKYFRKV
jgi:hypothetical protein